MRRFLLDTHCWLWWISDPEKLGKAAHRLITSPENTVLFSAASSWEVTIKYQLGKLKLPAPPEQYVPFQLAQDQFLSLEIHTIHALHTGTLPILHKDPFDRMLIAQAQIEKIPILTSDPAFKAYDVSLIWAED